MADSTSRRCAMACPSNLAPGEVLIDAAGMNKTDINARTRWFNQTVLSGTTAERGKEGYGVTEGGIGDWESGLTCLRSPRMAGRDCASN